MAPRAMCFSYLCGLTLLSAALGFPLRPNNDRFIVTNVEEKVQAGTFELNTTFVNLMKDDIVALMPANVFKKNGFEYDTAEIGDVAAAAVQLAFHDAGTYDSSDGSGGPDGCIDLSIGENMGLTFITTILAPVYQKYADYISYADFVVLAANTMIEERIPKGYSLELPFRYGRVDGTDCTTVDHGRLPAANPGWSHVKEVFVERMGLSVQDISALMGAHTFGRAQEGNSGFEGSWTSTKSSFDNMYYIEMIRKPWERVHHTLDGQDLYFWVIPDQTVRYVAGVAQPTTIMLNTDMAVAFEIGEDDELYTDLESRCFVKPKGGCARRAENEEWVDNYYNNQTLWYQDFAAAWQKMTELGWEGQLNEPTFVELTEEEAAAAAAEAAEVAEDYAELTKDHAAFDSAETTEPPKVAAGCLTNQESSCPDYVAPTEESTEETPSSV